LKLTEKQFSDAIDALDELIGWKTSKIRVILNSEYSIMKNQRKAKRLDIILGSPYTITYHGAGKYATVAVLNKQHLEQLLEKEKKYDDLMKANSEIVQNNISHTEIFQENKSLKEELDIAEKRNSIYFKDVTILEKTIYESNIHTLNLKAKLDKYELFLNEQIKLFNRKGLKGAAEGIKAILEAKS